jgi:hypothetical protein
MENTLNVSEDIKGIVDYTVSLISKKDPNRNFNENIKKFAKLADTLDDEDYRVCIKHLMFELAINFPEFKDEDDLNGKFISNPPTFRVSNLKTEIQEAIAISMNNSSYTNEKRKILISAVTDFDLIENNSSHNKKKLK